MPNLRIYRLDIDYPPRSQPWMDDYDPWWHPSTQDMGEESHREADTGAVVTRGDVFRFRWPAERLFLARSGANVRASKLRGWGCRVTVVASEPITFPTTPTA